MKIVPFFFLTICVLLQAACSSTNINSTYTSNGVGAYQISCGGVFGGGDISACYLAAGATCADKGYSVSHTGINSIIISCKTTDETINREGMTKN